jgi:dUTP pyrophosphatase
MKLKIKKLNNDAVMPTYAHSFDAGMDLRTVEEVIVKAGEDAKIKTGLAMEIPEGYVGLVWDKSGIGSKGLKTLGGVIDAHYRGEIMILMRNLNNEDYTFQKGDKVAQLLIQKIEHPEIEEANELSETVRGEGRFGSTGK